MSDDEARRRATADAAAAAAAAASTLGASKSGDGGGDNSHHDDGDNDEYEALMQRLNSELSANDHAAHDARASPDALRERVDVASRVLVAALPWLDAKSLTLERRNALAAHVDRLRRSTEQLAAEQRRAAAAAETTRRAYRLADRLNYAADASLSSLPLSLRRAIDAQTALKVRKTTTTTKMFLLVNESKPIFECKRLQSAKKKAFGCRHAYERRLQTHAETEKQLEECQLELKKLDETMPIYDTLNAALIKYHVLVEQLDAQIDEEKRRAQRHDAASATLADQLCRIVSVRNKAIF